MPKFPLVACLVVGCLAAALAGCSASAKHRLGAADDAGLPFGGGQAGSAGTSAGAAGSTSLGSAGSSATGNVSDGGPATTHLDGAVKPHTDAGHLGGSDAGSSSTDDDSGTLLVDSGTLSAPWPPPPATGELAGLPSNLATAVCSAVSQCLKPTLYEVAYRGKACVALVEEQLQDGEYVYLQASIDAGRVGFDPSALSDCYNQIAAEKCSVFQSRSPAACNTALHGRVPNGGACVIDNDCQTGSFCDRSASCPGMCATLLGSGSGCDRSEQCAEGLLCSDAKCVAPAATGAACEGGVAPPCQLDALCVGADASKKTAGKCVDQNTALALDAGQDCDPINGKWCKDGLACVVDVQDRGSPATPTVVEVCRARVAAGAACNFGVVPEQCPEGQYCPVDLNPTYQGTCANKPAPGEACGPFDTCAPGAGCLSNVCHAIGRLGDSCSLDGDCASQRCSGSKCAAPARCRLDSQVLCGDDRCDTGEDCHNCASDCGACPVVCGDGSCTGTENCATCSKDCGLCPPVCGDQTCNGSETCASCVGDCGTCPPTCGDHSCNGSETCLNCAGDCGACPAPYSGPCSTSATCGAGKTCVTASVSLLPLLPLLQTLYGYCAQSCTTAADCSGNAQQTLCNSGSCALRCNSALGVLDPTWQCPTGMTCVISTGTCSWQR